MAWGFISELPVGPEEYDRVNAEITEDPEGLILHTSSVKDGRMRIVDVWESKEAFDKVAQEQIGPYTQEVGITEEPEINFYDVHNYLTK